MRSLHVAALPFPSPQGTQGLLHSLLSALADAGHETHLLCYGYGAGPLRAGRYQVHRLPWSLGLRSLRSGPSLRKIALDAALVRHVRALVHRLAPDVVVAHHVEAALACQLGRVPCVFFAHTSLRHELQGYFPASLSGALERLGAAIDRRACGGAHRVVAVAPELAALLRADTGIDVHALPVPWPVPAPITARERLSARAQLGFAPGERVLLYAGNLDAYQGLSWLAESVRWLAPQGDVRWLVATESDPAASPALRDPALRVRLAPLASERDRQLAHAAADVVAVPRAAPGGLPIKLLDALARGARVVTTRRAAAGLQLGHACTVVAEDDPVVFAQACAAQLARVSHGPCQAARDYVATAHAAAGFVAQFERHCAAPGSTPF